MQHGWRRIKHKYLALLIIVFSLDDGVCFPMAINTQAVQLVGTREHALVYHLCQLRHVARFDMVDFQPGLAGPVCIFPVKHAINATLFAAIARPFHHLGTLWRPQPDTA